MFRSPPVDLIVVLIIVLLLLGPKRLPGIGKGLGQGMREFKEGITGEAKGEEKPTLSEARTMPEPQPTPPVEPVARTGSGSTGSEQSK